MIVFEHPIFKYAFVDQRFLHEGDPLKEFMEDIVTMFDTLVNTLKDPKSFPNPRINEVVNLMWWLINQRLVKVALATDPRMVNIPGAAFSLIGQPELYEAYIWLPQNYARMAIADRIFHMGGICFNASQCRDFYNDQITKNPEHTKQRALAHEAEFLHTLAQSEKFKPNDWQKQVMELFPNGVASVQKLLYRRKQFMEGVS